MATYVVGDIHGCYDEWIALKDRIESRDKQAKFILVGDIIDRGPKTFKMLNWAIQNVTEHGKYQMIVGNHEDEKLQWWNTRCADVVERCILTHQPITIDVIPNDRYDFIAIFKKAKADLMIVQQIMDWFEALPLYKDIHVNGRRFVIVHANLPYEAISKEDENSLIKNINPRVRDFMLWDREMSDFNKLKNTILVHGHNASVFPDSFPAFGENQFTPEKLGRIIKCKNRYNIDCGLTYRSYYGYGNLAALRLEDLKEIYLYN